MLEIPPGVGQSIDVVEAKTVHGSVAYQLEHLGVYVVEDARTLDADADKVRDLEETPISQRFTRSTPMREPPYLQLVQSVQRSGIAGGIFDRTLKRGKVLLGDRAEFGFEVLCGFRSGDREPASELCKRITFDACQDVRIGWRRQRQHETIRCERERSFRPIEREAEILSLKRNTVRIGKRGHDELGRRPIDIEVRSVTRRSAPFEHVTPPRIERAHSHVVGHEIQHDADAMAT